MAERYEREEDWDARFEKWLTEKRKKDPEAYAQIKREIAETPISTHEIKTIPEHPDFSDKLTTKKPKKIEKYIVIAVYVIVIGFAIYLLLASFLPSYLPFNTNEYVIKAEDSLMFKGMKSFYIDDTSVLGKVETIGETKARPITSPKKFNFVLEPKVNVPENATATFTLNLLLDNPQGSNVYFNDKLIFPSLSGYQKVAESNSDYVYANDALASTVQKDFLGNIGNAEQFVYKNFPGASIWATRDLIPIPVSLPDYKQEDTLINSTFRDNLQLAVYAKGTLKIDLVKQDLNSYIGPDEYTINITNAAGEQVYQGKFQDDGINTKGSIGVEQPLTISVPNLPEGVYYISFTKDNFNDGADSSIKNIQINSNKVLILGNFLVWDKFNFYTETSVQKQITFYYWWKDKDQIIEVSGSKIYEIDLDEDWINKKYEDNLTGGEYNFKVEKGYLWVYSDIASPAKTNWFNIPLAYTKGEFNSQNVLIISKDVLQGNNLIYKQDVTLNKEKTLTSLRILDPNTISFVSAELKLN